MMKTKTSIDEALEVYRINRAGLSYAEIGKIKGLTKDQVGGMIQKARRLLPPEFSNPLSTPPQSAR